MPVKVMVRALKKVRDNGVNHEPGKTFEMEQSLVGPHVKAGQVELVGEKAAKPASNRQFMGGKNK